MMINIYLLITAAIIGNVELNFGVVRYSIMLVLTAFSAFHFITYIININISNGIGRAFVVYVVTIIVILFIHKSVDMGSVYIYLYYPIIFYAGYGAYKNIRHLNDYNIIISIQVLFFIIFFILYYYFRIHYGISHGFIKNTIYYQVMLIPFVLLVRYNKLRSILVILAVFSVTISLKRTALVGTGIALITFYYFYSRIYRSKQLSASFQFIIRGLFTLIIFIFTINAVEDKYGFYIYERFQSVLSDRGSGRYDTILSILTSITQSSLYEHLLGHYLQRSSIVTGTNSAHNDIVEVYWRMGTLGALAYLYLLYSIIKFKNIIKIRRSFLYPAFISSVVLHYFIASFSQLVFLPTYVGYSSLFWSFCVAHENNKSKFSNLHQSE